MNETTAPKPQYLIDAEEFYHAMCINEAADDEMIGDATDELRAARARALADGYQD